MLRAQHPVHLGVEHARRLEQQILRHDQRSPPFRDKTFGPEARRRAAASPSAEHARNVTWFDQFSAWRFAHSSSSVTGTPRGVPSPKSVRFNRLPAPAGALSLYASSSSSGSSARGGSTRMD